MVGNHFFRSVFRFYRHLGDNADLELEREILGRFPVDVLGQGQRLSENIELFVADVLVHCIVDQFIDLLGHGHRAVLLLDNRSGHHSFAEPGDIGILADILK